MDKVCNTRGKCLVNFMELHSMILVNGRSTSDFLGHFTYVQTTGSSTIDLFWCDLIHIDLVSDLKETSNELELFKCQKIRSVNRYRTNKPWYDLECVESKKRVKQVLKQMKLSKYNEPDKNVYISEKKKYVELVKNKKKSYTVSIIEKLGDCRSSGVFWNTINLYRKAKNIPSELSISCGEWVSYYRDTYPARNVIDLTFLDIRHPVLDAPIVDSEVYHILNHCKSGKAPGLISVQDLNLFKKKSKEILFVYRNHLRELDLDKDDLRLDSRIMEFNSLVNMCLARNPSSHGRDLHIRTYSVVPLNYECGLIEWVHKMVTFKGAVNSTYRKYGISPMRESEIKELITGPHDALPDKLKVFRQIFLPRHPPILHKWFFEQFSKAHSWYLARQAFIHTCAVMSIIGHIIGLGDRHGENILIDTTNGEVVHVDFNCIFDKLMKLCELLTGEKYDIILIQEPHCISNKVAGVSWRYRTYEKGERWKRAAVIVTDPMLDFVLLCELSDEDAVMVEVHNGSGHNYFLAANSLIVHNVDDGLPTFHSLSGTSNKDLTISSIKIFRKQLEKLINGRKKLVRSYKISHNGNLNVKRYRIEKADWKRFEEALQEEFKCKCLNSRLDSVPSTEQLDCLLVREVSSTQQFTYFYSKFNKALKKNLP
uniref:Serine/threonine-protein kinase ATR n=1 Tax=Rhodnius prolixus TaxID=13249 RepID=T1HJS6_RHOPR